ncbi:hypothetical protein [Paenibacillus sp. CMAA1364]
MKYALFIGVCDISDLLQYTCKVVTSLGRRTLLVDATKERFIQYATPTPQSDMRLIDFEGFDVASGYATLSELESSLMDNDPYEHVIIHSNLPHFVNKDDLNKVEKKYVVSTMEKWNIEKTVELLEGYLDYPDKSGDEEFTKVILNRVETNIADDFLEHILANNPLRWSDKSFEFIYDEVDYATKINNQHHGLINIRKLSKHYKHNLHRITKEITGIEDKPIRTAMKLVMRRS